MITDSMERLADAAGIRLEYVNGIPVWEALPVIRHQRLTDRIRASVRPSAEGESGCEFIHYPDITILFADGSIKRPDISVFCEEPAEQHTMCRTIPQAVIEILSRGYEKKDTDVSLPFYLAQQIRDIVILNPDTGRVSHYRDGQLQEHESPASLLFACGCRAIV